MPRPKVRPEDRQRSSKACVACKASKIRCDSELPCAACIRRDRASLCVYPPPENRSTARRNRRSIDARGGPASVRTASSSGDVVSVSGIASSTPRSSGGTRVGIPDDAPVSPTSVSRPPSRSPDTTSDSSSRQRPEPRLMITSIGEKVYIGETASLSFVHFLRRALKPYIGSMPFTDGNGSNVMLEASTEDVRGVDLELSPQQKNKLIEAYCEVTSGILDLFTAAELDMLITDDTSLPLTRHHLAALDMILAIGAQASIPGTTKLAAAFFARAQRIAFEDMLAHPCLGMVRLFVLLAIYMLGACQRNAASMYLGVAAKAAVILGLHQPGHYKNLQPEEHSARLRVWNSLRVVETITTFLLGRPSSLPASRRDMSGHINSRARQDTQFCSAAFNSIVEACALLDATVQKLSRGRKMDIATAEGLLEQLRRWSKSLPAQLRQFAFTDAASLTSADRQWLLANLHVSCVYYFAVMVLTRQFLISHMMGRLRRKASQKPATLASEEADKVSSLAEVCVSSASYIADICRKMQIGGFSFGNMCYVKAWLFGAGLVLGFSLFAGEPRAELQDAFLGARAVLQQIGCFSPQAKLYYEILVQFADAIAHYRMRVSRQTRRAVDQYIDQILVIDSAADDDIQKGERSTGDGGGGGQPSLYPSPSGSKDDNDTYHIHPDSMAVDSLLALSSGGELGHDPSDEMDLIGDFQGWDDITLQLSENFSFTYEPFEGFFG